MTAGEAYDRWRPAIDVIGWPEWEDGGVRYRLFYDPDAFAHGLPDLWTLQEWTGCQGTKWVTIKTALLTPHVAACILRDWARAWLVRRGYVVADGIRGTKVIPDAAVVEDDVVCDDSALIEWIVEEAKGN